MKQIPLYKGCAQTITIYSKEELQEKLPIIEQAKQLWKDRCNEYMSVNGDQGICVIGAGFSVYNIPKGKRTYRKLMILSAYTVTPAQGSLVWENSKDEIKQFLKNNGLEVTYNWGTMD